MSERELDVCQAGEAVYLTQRPVAGDVLGPGADPCWLVLNESLHIQVTRHANPRKRPVIVRLPVADLPVGNDGRMHITTAALITRHGPERLTPILRSLGPDAQVRGHIATVTGGAIAGWATDGTRPTQEVPVEVAFPDRTLIGMTNGRWHGDVPRAFSIPLPTDLPKHQPVLVKVRAMPGGAPFARAPFYLTPTSAGWLLATPIRRQGAVIEGEFLLASAPKRPVSVTLKTADGRAFRAECSLSSEVRFGARPCGFRIDGLPDARLETARLQVAHDMLDGDGIEFDLNALRARPGRDAPGTVTG